MELDDNYVEQWQKGFVRRGKRHMPDLDGIKAYFNNPLNSNFTGKLEEEILILDNFFGMRDLLCNPRDRMRIGALYWNTKPL